MAKTKSAREDVILYILIGVFIAGPIGNYIGALLRYIWEGARFPAEITVQIMRTLWMGILAGSVAAWVCYKDNAEVREVTVRTTQIMFPIWAFLWFPFAPLLFDREHHLFKELASYLSLLLSHLFASAVTGFLTAWTVKYARSNWLLRH